MQQDLAAAIDGFSNHLDDQRIELGFSVIQKLADSPSHIIPGHDRQVLSLFPAARDGLDGLARLDVEPTAALPEFLLNPEAGTGSLTEPMPIAAALKAARQARTR